MLSDFKTGMPPVRVWVIRIAKNRALLSNVASCVVKGNVCSGLCIAQSACTWYRSLTKAMSPGVVL